MHHLTLAKRMPSETIAHAKPAEPSAGQYLCGVLSRTAAAHHLKSIAVKMAHAKIAIRVLVSAISLGLSRLATSMPARNPTARPITKNDGVMSLPTGLTVELSGAAAAV